MTNAQLAAGKSNKGAFHYDYLVLALNSLINLIKEEIAFLDSSNLEALSKIQNKKEELATFIERQQQNLINNPEIISNFSDHQKLELKALIETFRKITKESNKTLGLMRFKIETLMKIASKSLKNRHGNLQIYTNKGVKSTRPLKIMAPHVGFKNEV
jgi:hypothetical protein